MKSKSVKMLPYVAEKIVDLILIFQVFQLDSNATSALPRSLKNASTNQEANGEHPVNRFHSTFNCRIGFN